MKTVLVLAILLAASTASAEPPAVLPLRLERAATLPLGMRLELAPGVMVGTDALGVGARATLRGWRNLVMVRTDVSSVHLDEEWKVDWAVRVHLGEHLELATRHLAGRVLGGVRRGARKIL